MVWGNMLAIPYFKRSISNQGADWADVQTFVYQGLCYYQLGEYEEAISSHENGLAQYDTTCEAYFGLAQVYLKLGDTIQAKYNLSKAQETIGYKYNDVYKEYLNEIYQEDLDALSKILN